jgi:hypothetical protein
LSVIITAGINYQHQCYPGIFSHFSKLNVIAVKTKPTDQATEVNG